VVLAGVVMCLIWGTPEALYMEIILAVSLIPDTLYSNCISLPQLQKVTLLIPQVQVT